GTLGCLVGVFCRRPNPAAGATPPNVAIPLCPRRTGHCHANWSHDGLPSRSLLVLLLFPDVTMLCRSYSNFRQCLDPASFSRASSEARRRMRPQLEQTRTNICGGCRNAPSPRSGWKCPPLPKVSFRQYRAFAPHSGHVFLAGSIGVIVAVPK